MFSWFRAEVKAQGLFPATRLFFRVVRYRIPVTLSNKLLADKLECPCCGWKGRRFLDYIEVGYRVPNAACPSCDSHARHRALYLWLKQEFQLEQKRGRALVFAPERALAPLWQAALDLRVIKTDRESNRGVDLLADIMRLPFADESMDLIWCHHVLDQVEDDRVAMQELFRVLKAEGELLVSVGLTGRETTQEFHHANKMFSGNRRLYGSDFSERLKEAGFRVTPLAYDLSAEELERYGVYRETFYRCGKTG